MSTAAIWTIGETRKPTTFATSRTFAPSSATTPKSGDVGSLEPRTFVYGGTVFKIEFFSSYTLDWGGGTERILGTGSYILYVDSQPQPFEGPAHRDFLFILGKWPNVSAFTPGRTLSLRLVEVFESGLTLALPDGSAAALTRPALNAVRGCAVMIRVAPHRRCPRR